MSEQSRIKALAACGIVGVIGFVVAWAIRGSLLTDYSPIHDAISRLAAVGVPGRGWMTAGFIAFGVGVPLFAQALRTELEGWAWIAATLTGLATIGVALSPLGRFDAAHNALAFIGYLSLAATPLLASRAFGARGADRWRIWSLICGLGSAAFLAATMLDWGHGLTQRLGLGFTDIWIVTVALWLIEKSPTGSQRSKPLNSKSG